MVVVSGRCPGLTLEDLSLCGFKQNAIVTWNCQGRGNDRPVTLKNVRVAPTRAETESALCFNANPRIPQALNQDIIVQDCRFEGPFRKAAIQIDSPLVGAEFRGNRFFNTKNGFVYAKASPRHPLQATFESNTFCNVPQIAFFFEGIPLTSSDSRIVIRNNLFANTSMLAQVGEPERLGETSLLFQFTGNVTDAGSKEGNLPLRASTVPFTLPMNPANDAAFLRYPRSNPLARAGADHQPVGVPPVTD
jgi:hypothetical protein